MNIVSRVYYNEKSQEWTSEGNGSSSLIAEYQKHATRDASRLVMNIRNTLNEKIDILVGKCPLVRECLDTRKITPAFEFTIISQDSMFRVEVARARDQVEVYWDFRKSGVNFLDYKASSTFIKVVGKITRNIQPTNLFFGDVSLNVVDARMATAICAQFSRMSYPGNPIYISIHAELMRCISWNSAIRGKHKLFFELKNYHSEDQIVTLSESNLNIYGVLTGPQLYLNTTRSFRSIVAAGYGDYEFGAGAALTKNGDLDHGVSGTKMSRFIEHIAYLRLGWYALLDVADAFRHGRAFLDEGRLRIPRDVGSVIARHILRFPTKTIKTKFPRKPTCMHPVFLAFQMLHRARKRKKPEFDLDDEVREAMERFVRRRRLH